MDVENPTGNILDVEAAALVRDGEGFSWCVHNHNQFQGMRLRAWLGAGST